MLKNYNALGLFYSLFYSLKETPGAVYVADGRLFNLVSYNRLLDLVNSVNFTT